jgi:hypothetical protein
VYTTNQKQRGYTTVAHSGTLTLLPPRRFSLNFDAPAGVLFIMSSDWVCIPTTTYGIFL